MAVSLSTEDKLEYHFYPVTAGQIQFRVKAPNDAHIALTTGPNEGDPMYEVFIGGWSNSKSVVRKNRTKPDVVEVETPGILDADDYRGFWIRWDNGNGITLTVGKEGESDPFLSYTDPEPFGIGYFGVCTGWGATGDWLIEAICCGGGYGGRRNSLNTPNKLEYKFHAVRSGSVLIDVKAKSNGHIALTDRKGESSPMYEIMLGGWENKASVIRYDRKQPDKVRVDTPNLLSEHEHRRFSITWLDGLITVRSGGQNGAVLMEWRDPNPIGVSYVGVRTGWGATGNWKLRFEHYPTIATGQRKHPGTTPSAPLEVRGLDAGNICWCDASGGMIPPGAVEGGNDDGVLFVGRAHHEGALIPGKVKPSHSVCYVAWGGAEHGKTDYQVLCGCNPTWVPVSGGSIPSNAIPGGETEDGEPLFVGRVHHEGTLTIGKVQPSHNVCYIAYAGSEIAFPEYEVMVGQ
ncbi:uncharacterized protein LOC105282474 isoform X1 [Ooceraea biroi]|uniref:uncharacterized protein LOC105282474 isoform X1 n=1 Tax=Ooceraea biroi TaxID=2015173 RepID=UPI0005BB12D9|nr:uncharacterized protein LOC105282474 isoform X1 [Ooceraea biroi]